MRVLVTGVSGFAGSHIAGELVADGHDVVGIHRRRTAFLNRLGEVGRLRLVSMDIADIGHLSGPFDAVVHAAATSPAPGITDDQIVRDNLGSTTALVAATKDWNTRSFIFFSSLSIYGDVTGPVLDEACPIVNPDVYGATKYLCERLLAERADQLPSLSLRLPGVLGPGAHRNWLAMAAANILAGRPVRAFNLDGPYNNAAHVVDLAALVRKYIETTPSGCDAVVLGARGSIPFRNAIERLAHGLGRTVAIETTPPSKHPFVLSSERAMSRWGYAPMEIGEMIDRYASETRPCAA